jgi:hypothetical protein
MTTESVTATVAFRKLGDTDVIQPADFHSRDNGLTLNPILHADTIGQTVGDFSKARSFWRVRSITGTKPLTT